MQVWERHFILKANELHDRLIKFIKESAAIGKKDKAGNATDGEMRDYVVGSVIVMAELQNRISELVGILVDRNIDTEYLIYGSSQQPIWDVPILAQKKLDECYAYYGLTEEKIRESAELFLQAEGENA